MKTTQPSATVIGLGQMGSTLARLLLDAGYRTTVWNRSPDRARPLVARGAVLAGSALEAVQASLGLTNDPPTDIPWPDPMAQ